MIICIVSCGDWWKTYLAHSKSSCLLTLLGMTGQEQVEVAAVLDFID